jgi:hypothetical protein
MKKLLCLCLLSTTVASFAQKFDPSALIAGARSDINYLGGEYLSPVGKSLAIGLNNGWYTSAKTHKVGRVEVMFTPTVVFIPKADRSFTIDPTKLSELELFDPNDNVAPTAAGESNPGPVLEYKNQFANYRFEMPEGSGWNVLPFAHAQIAVGLPFNTDVSFRYIPEVSLFGEGGKVGMYGFAVKHDVLQWLPGGKALPFDVSAMVGYTKLDFSLPIDDSTPDGGEVAMSSSGYTIRGLISKKLLFITFLGGVGYNSGTTDINIRGTYAYTDPQTGINTSIQDPLSTTATSSGFVGQAGIRLKFLWVMCFSADYTFGAYSAATAGIGASIDF